MLSMLLLKSKCFFSVKNHTNLFLLNCWALAKFHFHEFFTQFIFDNFLVKSKLSTAKKSKTTTFSRVFHPKKIDNLTKISKLNFWTKNEDFEQCDFVRIEEKQISERVRKKRGKNRGKNPAAFFGAIILSF